MTRHNCGFTLYLRKFIAVALCCTWPVSFASAQELSIEPVRPAAPVLWRPYLAPEVPPVRLSNSERLRNLIRAGKLYLRTQDASRSRSKTISILRWLAITRFCNSGASSAPRPVVRCRACPAARRRQVRLQPARASSAVSRPRESVAPVATAPAEVPPMHPSPKSAR